MFNNINNAAYAKNSYIQHVYLCTACFLKKQTHKQTLVLAKPGRKTIVFPDTNEKKPKEAKMFCCFIGYGKRMRTV
jgi:hypothetical protein